jgi:hypothetical protein
MLIIYLYTEFHIPSHGVTLIIPVKLKLNTFLQRFYIFVVHSKKLLEKLNIFNEPVAEQA